MLIAVICDLQCSVKFYVFIYLAVLMLTVTRVLVFTSLYLMLYAGISAVKNVTCVLDVVHRYFFCEKCYLCSHSDVLEVVDNPTQPPMYVVTMLYLFITLQFILLPLCSLAVDLLGSQDDSVNVCSFCITTFYFIVIFIALITKKS